ncbi:MAG: tRNA (adenosine(37)-N6)-threonylcarbamoyltransferase complex ATPase subunit type 1 TsaE [Halieaceae bacterium]
MADSTLELTAADETAMIALGQQFGRSLRAPLLVYLCGELGMGKTTLARGVLRAFGHQGAVKSPTYTLVEPYELEALSLYHFDLYRLGDPEELEYMGIRDYFHPRSIVLVEWPARGEGILPPPDMLVSIEIAGSGRILSFEARSHRGVECLQRMLKEPLQEPETGVR